MTVGSLIIENILGIFPEIFLGFFILFISCFCVFQDKDKFRNILIKSIVIFHGIVAIPIILFISLSIYYSSWLFIYNYSSYCLALFIVLVSGICVFLMSSKRYTSFIPQNLIVVVLGFEFSLLLGLYSNNLIIFFIAFELYTICLTLFILFDNNKNIDIAKRYLIISIVMGMSYVYGLSLYYLDFGGVSFIDKIHDISIKGEIGTFLILSYILFKMGASPFHSWMIDVYRSVGFYIILILDTISKIVMFIILMKMCNFLSRNGIDSYRILINISSIISMIIGCVAPFREDNIKKFMGYFSIGHIGFGLSVLCLDGNRVVLNKDAMIYVLSYTISSLLFFTSIIYINFRKKIQSKNDLSSVFMISKTCWIAMIIAILSMTSIPPFFGFLSKFWIFSDFLILKRYDMLFIGGLYSILSFVCVINILKYLVGGYTMKYTIIETCRKLSMRTYLFIITLISCCVLWSIYFENINRFILKIMR